jgi:hypothetical protein
VITFVSMLVIGLMLVGVLWLALGVTLYLWTVSGALMLFVACLIAYVRAQRGRGESLPGAMSRVVNDNLWVFRQSGG